MPTQEEVNKHLNGAVPEGRIGSTSYCNNSHSEENHIVLEENQLNVSSSSSQPVVASAPEKDITNKNNSIATSSKGNTSSSYRGVSWYASRRIWKASIQVFHKKKFLGRFATEEEGKEKSQKKKEINGL